MNLNYASSVISLSLLSMALAEPSSLLAFTDDNVDLTPLGNKDLSTVNFELINATVDDDCNYHFEIHFKHPKVYPIGTLETCQPTVIADDGLPMLAPRSRWGGWPSSFQKASGLDHISIDYNPCGHPTGGWLSAHYDLHFYRVTPEYRILHMDCDVISEDPPVCNSTVQTTPSGRAFFSLARSALSNDDLSNMPHGYEFALDLAFRHMGLHTFDFNNTPATVDDWTEPSYILLNHDSQIVAIEPMLPTSFFMGDADKFSESDVDYVEQTDMTLPFYYSVKYDSTSGFVTVIFKGRSAVCSDEFQALLLNEDDNSESSGVYEKKSTTILDTQPPSSLSINDNAVIDDSSSAAAKYHQLVEYSILFSTLLGFVGATNFMTT